jgi:hypothetical protein
MAVSDRKRFIVELVTTAIASPVLIVVLSRSGAETILLLLGWPCLWLGSVLAHWIGFIFATDAVGYIYIWISFLLFCILVWVILFAVVRLVERLIKRKKREA